MAGFVRLADSYDVVVVGGGHAGLHAGLKTALFRFSAAVISRGPKYGRSYYAPQMVNIPGFPEGISGHKLLDLQVAALRTVADRAAYVSPATVHAVHPDERGFRVEFEWLAQRRQVGARAVILAMGVVDRMPEIDGKIDAIFPWANAGIVNFCEFCDGHSMAGRSVAVLGHDAFAAETALDLLHFAPTSVEILTAGRPFLDGLDAERSQALRRRLEAIPIPVSETPIVGYEGIREKRFGVRFGDGTLRTFDKGFSGLGWYDLHTEIPRTLGARLDEEGNVWTDDDNRVLSEGGAPIPGLYCVGDLARGWNQIPEAWAHAERAVIHAYREYL